MPLSFERVQKLLSTFTYKPGWALEIVKTADQMSWETGTIRVLFYAPDSTRRAHPPVIQLDDDYRYLHHDRLALTRVLDYRRFFKQNLQLIEIYSAFTVPQIVSEHEFWKWLDKKLAEVEQHERHEFFKVNGVPIYDPHKVA